MSHALLSACQRSGYRSCHTPCFPDHHPCLAATAAVTAPGSKGVLLSPHARLVVSMVATQLTLFGKPAEKNESHRKKNGARRWKRGTITSEPGCESVEMQPVQDMVAEPGCESVEMQPSAMERPVQDKAAKPGSETQAASSSNDNITSFDPSLKRGHDPVCTRCGHHVDTCAPGVRLARKHPPEWQCQKCSSKCVMLTRMFGKWPVPEWTGLTEEEQHEFFRSTESTKKSLGRAMTEVIKKTLTEESRDSKGGKFLPLKVWENQGFDPEHVKAKGKYEWHPVLGDTYQVMIHKDSREQVETLARQQVIKMMAKNKGEVPDDDDNEDEGSKNGAGSEDKEESEKKSKDKRKRAKDTRHKKSKHAKRSKDNGRNNSSKSKKGKRSKDKDSSHSSSDDSSSNDRLQRQRAQKEEGLRIKKVKLEAQKVIAKVGPVLASVMPTLKHAKISLVPKPLYTRATEVFKVLQTLETEAREKASDGGPSMSHTLEEVGAKCKVAQDVHSMIKNILKSVESF